MNNTRRMRFGKLTAVHGYGLLLVVLAAVLAVPAALGIAEWSKNPRPLLTSGEMSGVPKARTGLVASADNRGQVLFGRYCDSCHTGGGEFSGPSFRTSDFKSEYTAAGDIVGKVRAGGFDMPAFPADLIPDSDLQQIADFVLNLPEDNP